MYSISLLWLFIIILLVVLFKLLDIKKNYIICFSITLLIIFFILNLQSCIDAALLGCTLVVQAIIPTIFPFTVICNLLISYDGINLYSKIIGPLFCKPLGLSKNCSFPIAASFLCGYPLGAKYSSDIYNLGYINKTEYQRMLNIASNAGPIFLLGSVGTAMLSNAKFGYILIIANYLSIIFVGFLTKKSINNSGSTIVLSPKYINKNFGISLKKAIENGISTTLNIAAFVIIFSVMISIIKNSTIISTVFKNIEVYLDLPSTSLYNLFLGSIEFTNGCKLIANSSLSINFKLSIISFICSFSSLSVLAQVSSIVSKDNISMIKYSMWKFIQGIISFIITFIISSIIINSTTISTINTSLTPTKNIYIFILSILIFLLLPLAFKMIYIKIKNLHIS